MADTTPRYSLAGRTALITGASSGFGAHFARLFVAAGARVVLGARRTDRLAALVGEIEAAGGEALAVAMDVTDEASTIHAFGAAEARFGPVDTLIANAGISNPGRTPEVPLGEARAVFDTNLLGVYLTAREGAKRMIAAGSRDSGRGRILVIGSITAHQTATGDAAYAASKAGVEHLARQLAREWVRMGINVNTIAPGYIRTEIAGDWFDTERGKAQIAGFHRRRMVPVEALDDMALYFASDASAAITGAVMTIDDGQSL